jgi:tRNA (guanine-N7-)-methyltransferase
MFFSLTICSAFFFLRLSFPLEIRVIEFYTKNMENQPGIKTRESVAGFGPIRSFGRIRGKKLSARQQWLAENLLPRLAPSPATNADADAILEIGFGAGEHLLRLAEDNPGKLIIGAEPFVNGVASLLGAMTENSAERLVKPEYKNIRIWPDDVRKLFAVQSPYPAFGQIWILHPDPWPKAKHEKRRLLSAEFLGRLAERLIPGGRIIIGTDHYEHYDWICEQAGKTGLRIAGGADTEVIQTRYQRKNKAGAPAPKYLILIA